MKKKIFGFIILIVFLIFTSIYMYIENFEISKDDLLQNQELSDEKIKTDNEVKKESLSKNEFVFVDSLEELKKEKEYAFNKNNNNNFETIVENENVANVVESEKEKEVVEKNIVTEEEKGPKAEEKTLDDETIEAAKNDAKAKDKVQAMALAVKKLSPEQIKRLLTISKGGFTSEEKAEALEMFYENFTEEEQEWILSKFEEYIGG